MNGGTVIGSASGSGVVSNNVCHNVVSTLAYTYDSDGNVKTINTESYSYNWLNELTSGAGPWGTTTYAYDKAGNMLNETTGGVTIKYLYTTYNRLSSIGEVNFTYDGNGNTHTIANGSNTWTYTYNYDNRLTQVQKGSPTVATYSYDGTGMLVQSVETATQVYTYHGDSRIYAKNTGSSSVADYFYADNMILASVNSTSTSYYHEDALGSVRMVSTSGSVLFSSDYRPYGPLSGASGSVAFEYTGKPTDSATNLYYSGARFYDQASGRFMNQDSSTGTQTAPLTLNRYIYACNDPMSVVDPSGHWGGEPPNYATLNKSPDPVGQALSAVSNWWNGLPPVTKVTLVVIVGVGLGIATCGVADVAIAAAAGGDAVVEGGAAAAESAADGVTLSTVAGKSAAGAIVGGGSKLAQDIATGTNPLTTSGLTGIGESAAVGAVGSGASESLLTVTGQGLGGQILAGTGGAVGSSVLNSALDGSNTDTAASNAGLSGAGGVVDGYYGAYDGADKVGNNLFDWGWGVLTSLS